MGIHTWQGMPCLLPSCPIDKARFPAVVLHHAFSTPNFAKSCFNWIQNVGSHQQMTLEKMVWSPSEVTFLRIDCCLPMNAAFFLGLRQRTLCYGGLQIQEP